MNLTSFNGANQCALWSMKQQCSKKGHQSHNSFQMENSIFVSFLLSRFKKHTKPSDTKARPQHAKLTKNYNGLDSCNQINQFCTSITVIAQGPLIIWRTDNTILWINPYPADECQLNILCYPLGWDLSSG